MSRIVAGLIVAVLTFAFSLSSYGDANMPSRVVLDNVDRYRVPEPLFEGVRVILAYRGESYSPAYLQGLSGAAFRLGGPCPCAPTCEYAMVSGDLLRMLGYEFEHLQFSAETEPIAQLPAMLAHIKDEIRAGRPVLVWNAFTTAEFDVVCGFDEEKHELIGRGSYMGLDDYASAPDTRPAEHDVAPAIGAVVIGKKVGVFDPRAAEISALREAVAHARGLSRTLTCLPTGLATYDYWIAAYQNRGLLIRAKSRDGRQDLDFVAAQTPNDFYPLTIYPSTHQAASEFLQAIAPGYPAAQAHLEAAAGHFLRESDALTACRETLGDRSKEPTDDQCVRAAAHLREARAMYLLGIEEIERALGKIDQPGPES
jgi:hypothetical protein